MGFELLPLKPEQHTITFIPRLSIELPFFNLTHRRKGIPKVIKYAARDDAGRPIRWEVYQDTSDEIGAPAVEAHEVWYLLVKPSIDSQRQANGTIPEIIPLGGIRECLRKVGWTVGGFQARELIKALTQISFAGCVADLWVPTGERDEAGKERFLQIKGRFSRLSVYAIGEYHLTEEELAQSKFEFDLQDILYIRLDPLEAKLQQLQNRRILDNQYLFSVNAAARRWYELMAAKIFGVVSNKGTFCEIRYSWYVQHHHTLKRYYEHKRVRFQMDRVIRDHLESGYISRAEYRAFKEPDQDIDFIVRYYPGPGAKESNSRIQTYIKSSRDRRNSKRQPASSQPISSDAIRPSNTGLSLLTAAHYDLMAQLIVSFRVSPLKAIELVTTRKDAAARQIEAWPFRQATPRNPAGWMIQAIENNYDLPPLYLDHKTEQREEQVRKVTEHKIRLCTLCDDKGFRHICNHQYPNGAMRKCTHNDDAERRHDNTPSSEALNSPPRSGFPEGDKRLAKDSTSP